MRLGVWLNHAEFFRHYQLVTASVEGSHKKTSSIKLDLDVVKRLFTNTTYSQNFWYFTFGIVVVQ